MVFYIKSKNKSKVKSKNKSKGKGVDRLVKKYDLKYSYNLIKNLTWSEIFIASSVITVFTGSIAFFVIGIKSFFKS